MDIKYYRREDLLVITFSKIASEGGKESFGMTKTADVDMPYILHLDNMGKLVEMEIHEASTVLDIDFLKTIIFHEE
jgi:hypothetical protein